MPEQASAKGLQPVERTHDGAIERSCYRLTATPLCPLLPWTRGGREAGGSKWEVESEERRQHEGQCAFLI